MTDRQKFWLKVLLTVTWPVWLVPFLALYILGGLIAVICVGVWGLVSELLDPPKKYGSCKRFP